MEAGSSSGPSKMDEARRILANMDPEVISSSPEFYCFKLLTDLIKDPVELSNGKMEKRIGGDESICAMTKEPITQELKPNDKAEDMILRWGRHIFTTYKQKKEAENQKFREWVAELDTTLATASDKDPALYSFKVLNKFIGDHPVKLSTGQVCGRSTANILLQDGFRKCPFTGEELTSKYVPDEKTDEMIRKWGVELKRLYQISVDVDSVNDNEISSNVREVLKLSFQLLASDSTVEQEVGVQQIEMIATSGEHNLHLMKIPRVLSYITRPVLVDGGLPDIKVLSSVINILNHFSLERECRSIIGKSEDSVKVIVLGLNYGRLEIRERAAETLGRLLDEIGTMRASVALSDAIGPLVRLLSESQKAINPAIEALRDLVSWEKNKELAYSNNVIGIMKARLNQDTCSGFARVLGGLVDGNNHNQFIENGGVQLVMQFGKIYRSLQLEALEDLIVVIRHCCGDQEQHGNLKADEGIVHQMVAKMSMMSSNEEVKKMGEDVNELLEHGSLIDGTRLF